jgi:hypothetical protein
MKTMYLAFIAIVVLSFAAQFTLGQMDQTTAAAAAGPSVRLD